MKNMIFFKKEKSYFATLLLGVTVVAGSIYTSVLRYPKSETFFRYQIVPIPNPILFSIPNLFNIEPDTFFDTKLFSLSNPKTPKNWKVLKPNRHTLMGIVLMLRLSSNICLLQLLCFFPPTRLWIYQRKIFMVATPAFKCFQRLILNYLLSEKIVQEGHLEIVNSGWLWEDKTFDYSYDFACKLQGQVLHTSCSLINPKGPHIRMNIEEFIKVEQDYLQTADQNDLGFNVPAGEG